MRTFSAVTTCNRSGYEQYGREMIASFDRHWPTAVPLHVYVEDFVPEHSSPRIAYLDLLGECPELVAFKKRHASSALANGRSRRKRLKVAVDWSKPKVKIRRIDWGLGYQWDAVRFSHKTFAIFHAARTAGTDVLFWLDADIRVFADVPPAFLEAMMPETCLLSYLARPKFSECGFVGYNLRHPAILDFIAAYEAMYADDKVFALAEFHDSFVFDVVRRRFERRGCKTYDIGHELGARSGHVFVNSPLGRYMDHMKGERKDLGASRRSDVIVPRDEAYWHDVAV
jgi:hypothetical protein